MRKLLTNKDYAQMNHNMAIDVIENLKRQMFDVNPQMYHNCLGYVIWKIQEQNYTIQVLTEKVQQLNSELQELQNEL